MHRAAAVLSLSFSLALAQAPALPLGGEWAAQWQLRSRLETRGADAHPFNLGAAPAWQVATGQTEVPPAYEGTRLVVVHARPKRLQALDARTGGSLWEVPFTGLLEVPPTWIGDRVCFALDGGRIVVLEGATGALKALFRLAPPPAGESEVRPRLLFPAVAGDLLVAAWSLPGTEGKGDRTVSAFDLGTGAARWAQAVPGPLEAHPLMVEGRVVVGGNQQVTALDLATGQVAWAHRPAKRTRLESLQLVEGRVIGRTAAGLFALDPGSGRLLWTLDLERPSLVQGLEGRLVVSATRGAFASSEWLLGLDPGTGQQRWELEVGEARLPWLVPGRVITTSREELLALDLATGRLLWRKELGGALLLPLLVQGSDGVAIHRAKGGSRIFTFNTATGAELATSQTKERWGGGSPLQGPRGLILPLPEGGLAAFP